MISSCRRVVLVTGGRDYRRKDLVWRALWHLHPGLVVTGCADGADRWARKWVATPNVWRLVEPVGLLIFRADWSQGRKAGPLRNRDMVEFAAGAQDNGDAVIVLKFPGGRGTADMVRRCRAAGLLVHDGELVHDSKTPWVTTESDATDGG